MTPDYKLKIWKRLYTRLIDGYLKNDYGLTPFTPHIVVKEIRSEIEENSLRNPHNQKLFIDQINILLENDPYIISDLSSEFEILKKGLNTNKLIELGY